MSATAQTAPKPQAFMMSLIATSETCKDRPEKARRIAEWILSLARALPAKEGRITQRLVLQYTELFIDDFEWEAFTDQSKGYVLRHLRFFPSYAEIMDILKAWCREHMASGKDETQRRKSGLNDEEWENLQAFKRRKAARFCIDAKDLPDTAERARRERNAIAFIKDRYPRAWAYYTGVNLRENKMDWSDREVLKKTMLKINTCPNEEKRREERAMIKTCLTRYNPLLLPLLGKESA